MFGVGINLWSNIKDPSGLSLDLQFAVDQTLTARRGPTPVFTRASRGTYYRPIRLIVNDDNSAELTENLSLVNGRTIWQSPVGGSARPYDYLLTYNGLQWTARIRFWLNHEDYEESHYNAAPGSEWLPYLARWNSNEVTVVAGDTFGIASAQNNEPRFDHDPVTGVCRGLLIEEQRTNLLLGSNGFTAGQWAIGGGTFSTPTHVAPDGGANSFLFSEDTSSGAHRTFQAFTGVSGTTYTTSIFLKFAGRAQVFIETRSITSNPFAVFNLQTGVVSLISGPITASMEQFPNGWWRCSITGTANAAGGNTLIGGFVSGLQNYVGSGSAAFYAFGAQVEAGVSATSYIPTTTTTLARSQDLCTISDAAFASFYNQVEGTVFAEVKPISGAGLWGIHGNIRPDGGSSMSNQPDLNAVQFFVWTAGFTTQANFTASVTPRSRLKSALAIKANDFAASVNGGIATDTAGNVVNIVNRLVLGANGNQGGPQAGSAIFASFRYYRKRLPNAKLQTLSTL